MNDCTKSVKGSQIREKRLIIGEGISVRILSSTRRMGGSGEDEWTWLRGSIEYYFGERASLRKIHAGGGGGGFAVRQGDERPQAEKVDSARKEKNL